MKTNTLKKQTKLTTYLALTAGAGLAATAANGATVVTFYGPGTRNPDTGAPVGINIGTRSDGLSAINIINNNESFFRYSGVFLVEE